MAIELSQDPKKETDIGKAEASSRIEKISSILAEIENGGEIADSISATPGAFLWEFYKAWVDNGGQDGGKNRNSIRRMRDVWLTGDHEVKSLHPKLTGRVRLSKSDAQSLMSLFLGRWKFVGVKEGDWVLTSDGYAPFPCSDCKVLCERLAEGLYPKESKQSRIGLLLPARAFENQPATESTGWAALVELYQNLDALIIQSRHHSTIGPTPWDTIRLFWDYMNYLYENIRNKEMIFIWIVDIGPRQAEDDRSWKDFLNFEMMKTQFRAFASFDSENDLDDDPSTEGSDTRHELSDIHDAFLRSLTIPEEGHREKRWKWLCQRSVVVVQNLRKEEFQPFYKDEDENVDNFRLRDIGITAENILPSMVPNKWSRLKELRDLYGGNFNDISDGTFAAHFNLPKKDGKPSVRYFAHALGPHVAGELHLDSVVRAYEIASPGLPYDEAMNLVYWAARHRLRNAQDSIGSLSYDENWAIAVAYLNKQGFRILRLPEFMTIYRSPGS